MVSLDKIREDLREVRYYYTRKELFDETFKSKTLDLKGKMC